ncbi:ATP-binding cassette domain-containing protein [Aeromicrobium sp. CTD01-1L150]|uniref:ATP-binding cassette domain-containing protein n=1 Tax=Aeromicrobium sp. CTD01-1L150 TaxID=3341830 RepID=UPI0035C24554
MTSIELRGVFLDAPDGSMLLDGVDLHVPSGETVVVCGPPGAGKTALLRVLVGLDEHADGDVLLDGVVVNAVGARDRDLALVFQDHALHPHLDTHDNLAFAARLRRHDKAELAERIDEVAGLLALSSLLDLKPVHLDDAQRQRVAIGRSLTRDALAYLFDEPFSAQPDRVRTHVRSVVTQWQRESAHTSIFTTSRVDEALTLSDRVVVMHQGAVRQAGSPEEIYVEPADLFVAAFLGQPAMNLFPATRRGSRLVSPMLDVPVDDELERLLGDREEVILGVRPEHCLDGTSDAARSVPGALQLTSRVDDVEWSGGTQLAYLGYEVDPEVEQRLEAIEDELDYDLFQNFFVAELPAISAGEPARLQTGQAARICVPRDRLHVFDAVTGDNLRRPPVRRREPVVVAETDEASADETADETVEDSPEDPAQSGEPAAESTGDAGQDGDEDAGQDGEESDGGESDGGESDGEESDGEDTPAESSGRPEPGTPAESSGRPEPGTPAESSGRPQPGTPAG